MTIHTIPSGAWIPDIEMGDILVVESPLRAHDGAHWGVIVAGAATVGMGREMRRVADRLPEPGAQRTATAIAATMRVLRHTGEVTSWSKWMADRIDDLEKRIKQERMKR